MNPCRDDAPHGERTQRVRLLVRGVVQGVGFRPWVFRWAERCGLAGWVANDGHGVWAEVEGSEISLKRFMEGISRDRPSGVVVESQEATWLEPAGYQGFEIRESRSSTVPEAWIRPDVATCGECRREIHDAGNRRHRYPFTNCTVCGPRYSILTSLPYDRPNTSMSGFGMCPECQAEYDDPRDRRFHAQPNACPICGPHLDLLDGSGGVLATREGALVGAIEALRAGRILAVKGLGGFHLMARADRSEVLLRLRDRKRREEKPFALMVPSLEVARRLSVLSPDEERLLEAPEAPIVLVRRRTGPGVEAAIAFEVAPGMPCLGIMLPYTPLHHLILGELGFSVVATSGNLSDEPLCIENGEALDRLGGIADGFLVHNRPILRPVDDSIVRVVDGRELVLRRARGFAPMPLTLGGEGEEPVLALGAHQKSALALAVGRRVIPSQHIGDLDTVETCSLFRRVAADLQRLHGVEARVWAADLHPDYHSSVIARESGFDVQWVQHHHAHVLAVVAENEIAGPVLGVAWDGSGLGLDGTLWGGEFLEVEGAAWRRVAHLRTFRLPGGDAAAREPRRAALGLLHEWGGEAALDAGAPWDCRRVFEPVELSTLRQMLRRALQSPRTSSVGRLFDAVAALCGLRQRCRFEGQAAMELEGSLGGDDVPASGYRIEWCPAADPGGAATLDWAPMIEDLLADVTGGVPTPVLAGRFHRALIEAIVEVARRAGMERVVLGGGCFQNVGLLRGAQQRLAEEGFRCYRAQRVPPNDGGIAVGQVVAARAARRQPAPATDTARGSMAR